MYDYMNQAKVNSFYERNFANKYNPFPSLNPYGSHSAINNQRGATVMETNMNRPNVNPYDPFPSLTAMKTSPELYANQFYVSSKYRKTKLW
jgi:hypothetical protein